MRKRNAMIGFTILCSLALSGCTTEEARMSPEADPYLTQGRVQFESSTTKDLIHVARVDTQRVNGNLLKVILTLRNTTKKNLWVDIRTTFLDEGRHVLDQTNWEPTLLQARTVSEYNCTSLNNRAADYQIILRKPNQTSLQLP